jgi:proteasome lid subunit RPN8/RPN11
MTSAGLPVVFITDELARRSAMLLDSFAQEGPSEGVVYWFGLDQPGAAIVTTLVVPDADTSRGCIRTSARANAQAIELMVGTPLVYIGQVHSHPGAHVWHSATDDTDTFARCDGVISVVVPWFGRYGLHLDQCGVHRHIGGRFRRIEHIDDHIRLIPGFADLRPGR